MMDGVAETETSRVSDILIVDDAPANLRLLSSILTKQGYKARVATDGQLALMSAQSARPDLILLDIMMPGMSGYEVCQQLKADPRTRDVPVIFISALGQTEDKVKAFTYGAVDYITKPFQLEEVAARVKTHLALHALQRQLETQNLELRKLTLAIEQSGSTIVITDTKGAIQYANPRFEETSGYTLSEALGQNTNILKSGEQSADYYRALWDTITSGQTWHGEFCNRRKDGTLYWESTTIAPVHNADGQITNYIAIKEDVTERKQAQEALSQYAEQLAAQNAELDAFAHTVAHDLKNPLATVMGYASLLETRYDELPPDVIQTAAQTIVRSTKKLNTIIEELLLLAGVRKGEVIPAPLAMARIVQEACERLQLATEQAQAQLSMPEPSAWPVALGYAPWVEEVWANYISNALKYGGQPPRVELGFSIADRGLRIADHELPPLEGKSEIRNPKSEIKFWVRDNGAGLTPDEQAKLFAPFTRLEQVRAKGHGLGLSIVRRIVEKLGGQVGVDSAGTAQGSTFWFTLPSE